MDTRSGSGSRRQLGRGVVTNLRVSSLSPGAIRASGLGEKTRKNLKETLLLHNSNFAFSTQDIAITKKLKQISRCFITSSFVRAEREIIYENTKSHIKLECVRDI